MSAFDNTHVWVLFGVHTDQMNNTSTYASSYVVGIFRTKGDAETQKIIRIRHDSSPHAHLKYYIKEATFGNIYDYHWNNSGEIP